jgi:phosphate transport system ATP-binding protein
MGPAIKHRPAVEPHTDVHVGSHPRKSREDEGPRLEADDLCASYASRRAIEHVTLSILPRQVTAIIGPSGCGKSTFLRCLNRMHELTPGAAVTGRVLLNGEDVYARGVDPVRVRRLVGMVFQKANPFPTMSIFDNVVAGLKMKGKWSRQELEEVAETALRGAALFDEVKHVGKKASGTSLSGGQQQRLCIARAIALKPGVILMDEPCAALDPVSTYKIEELIGDLKREYTIAIVTHNLQQASQVSDFTAFMLAGEDRVGRLVEHGPTAAIFTNPQEQRTEDYLTGRFG